MPEDDLGKAVETIKKRFKVVGRDEELCRVLITVMRNKHFLQVGIGGGHAGERGPNQRPI